MVKRGS